MSSESTAIHDQTLQLAIILYAVFSCCKHIGVVKGPNACNRVLTDHISVTLVLISNIFLLDIFLQIGYSYTCLFTDFMISVVPCIVANKIVNRI